MKKCILSKRSVGAFKKRWLISTKKTIARIGKMIKFENECVGCPKEMGCLGSSCHYTHVLHMECDNCGNEVEKLFDTEDGQMCEECVGNDIEDYDIITEDNACDFSDPYEEPDAWDYADLAYEQKRDERYMENEG